MHTSSGSMMSSADPSSDVRNGQPLDSTTGQIVPVVRHRGPAIPVALCFAAGIVTDRWLGVPWIGWLAASLFLAVCWLVSISRGAGGRAAVALLAACVCLGGARHHQFWSVRRSDDVSAFATIKPRPVRLVGRLATQPEIRDRKVDRLRSAWPQYDRSNCLVECEWLETNRKRIPVSGLTRLSVTGHLLHVDVGDEIDVRGSLYRPRPPDNPGEHDFVQYLRRLGTDCALYADYPDAVHRLECGGPWELRRWAARFRNAGEFVLVKHLSQQTVPTASALLLGNRTGMNDEMRRTFAESGMIHLLAISGLHVGILALFVWICCRVLNLSVPATSVVVLTCVVSYAFVTGGRPSTVRATVFLLVVFCGRPWYRQPAFANTLAIAALAILMWNPADLFDVGAQLSFLAVTAIIWPQSRQPDELPEKSPLEAIAATQETGWLRRGLRDMAAFLKQTYAITLAIWLFTTPLVAARFNLISPVGFVVNVVLIPLVIPVLWMGYGLLFCGFLIPLAAPVFGFAFDGGLRLLLGIVEAASRLRAGHLYVPSPPDWWLVGYYVLLVGIACFRGRKRIRYWSWVGLCAWTIFGLSIGLMPVKRTGLRCTFLSVGHGCSVLVELPGGRNMLYDAGSLSDGHRARRTVEGALWERGLSRLDVVVVSHADIDHFNAVPGLLRTVPVGSLLVARPFLDFEQESVAELCRSASAAGVPIQIIRRGDRLRLDEAVTLQVLHPAGNGSTSDDNANSVVLLIEYAGRRVLLTGDLVGAGLEQVLAEPPQAIDVLLAPHHGSARANSPWFAEWAQPRWVVVSGSRDGRLSLLREVYGDRTRLLSTNSDGAITFEIDPAGVIRGSTFRQPAVGHTAVSGTPGL